MMSSEPRFLTRAEIDEIHQDQISRYGGTLGLRDAGLLESALAQPSSRFGGSFLHADLFEMAAAYLFHLTGNHPFVDGNKRVGIVAAIVFLNLNGVSIACENDPLEQLVLRVAEARITKPEIAAFFRTTAVSNG
jgi:death-on-curing protein